MEPEKEFTISSNVEEKEKKEISLYACRDLELPCIAYSYYIFMEGRGDIKNPGVNVRVQKGKGPQISLNTARETLNETESDNANKEAMPKKKGSSPCDHNPQYYDIY